MKETSKCYDQRVQMGLFNTVFVGEGIDIGGGSDPLKGPKCNVRRWDMEDGDAQVMAGVRDNTYDFVYSSHCLEHLNNPIVALNRWIDITKPGGFIFVAVPDFFAYEKMLWPSTKNTKHKWAFRVNDDYGTHALLKSSSPVGGNLISIDDMLDQLDEYRSSPIAVKSIDRLGMWTNFRNYDQSLPASVDQTLGIASCQIEFLLRKSSSSDYIPEILLAGVEGITQY